ncbi:hypothetical protein HYW76_02850 [Candidatus Pacearchaeota archaeon]|nr:hypothetical protein [Candidatus Pacearchaeota archaeon]
MNFFEQKKNQLNRKDMSDEGKWDRDIENLCNKINLLYDYYTTSSCSGRIVLVKGIVEKADDVFLFKSHNKISFKQLKIKLEEIKKEYDKIVYFKQEPCILHVACQNVDKAKEFLQKATKAGWKRIGMLAGKKRVICELFSTEKLELPIIDEKKILVDDNYLKLLVREANSRLGRTRARIVRLENEI